MKALIFWLFCPKMNFLENLNPEFLHLQLSVIMQKIGKKIKEWLPKKTLN